MDKSLQLKIITALQDKLSGPLKKITGASGKSSKSVKELRDKLKSLESTQKVVGAFRSMSHELSDTRTKMAAAQDKVDALAHTLRATEAPTAAMRREFKQAVRASRNLKMASQEQAEKLQRLRDRLHTAGVSTQNLTSDERLLRGQISKTNGELDEQKAALSRVYQQQRKLSQVRERYAKTQQLASNMTVGGAASMGAGYAILRPVKGIVDAFAPLEDSATQLKVSMMTKGGQVGDQFQKISDLATHLGDELPGTTADFQNMMTMLKRQGMSDKTILGGLGEAAANMGVLLKLPVELAAEFGAKMQDALQAPESEMMKITDGMQRMYYAGVDANNILAGFTKTAPALAIIGKTGYAAFQQLSPLLAMFDQAGMQGEAAGNALRKVFQRSVDVTRVGKANAVLKELGVNLKLDFTNGKGEFGGLDKLFAQLKRLKSLTDVQRTSVFKKLFGDDAETLQVVTTMMNKGVAGYAEMQKKMAQQASLQERVKAQLGTLTNVAEAAGGNITNAMAAIGATIAPALKDILDTIGKIANSVGNWAKENPKLAATVLKIVAGLGVLLTVMGGLTIGIAAVLGPFAMARFGMAMLGIKGGILMRVLRSLGSVFPLVARGVLFIGRALMANPIGLLVTAIGAAAFLIYKYWDPIKAFFENLWSNITKFFSSGIGNIVSTLVNWSPIGLFYKAFAGVLKYLGVDLPAKFTDFGSMLMHGLVNGIKSMGSSIKNAVVNMGDNVTGWFKEKLGINSPSRVFMTLGGYVSEGAAAGIQAKQRLAEKAARIMATSVMAAGVMSPAAAAIANPPAIRFDTRPPVAARFASTPGRERSAQPVVQLQGDQVEIHIHATPDMRTDDLAKAISRELDRRERDKLARVRSSLSDYGN